MSYSGRIMICPTCENLEIISSVFCPPDMLTVNVLWNMIVKVNAPYDPKKQ